jgi:TatA/E family protein of Tat protein translocase
VILLFGIEDVVLISAIVLVVFGPDKLPEVARVLGKVTKEFRKVTYTAQRAWGEISQEIDLQDAQARAKLLEEKRRAEDASEVGRGQAEVAASVTEVDTGDKQCP